MSEAPPDPEPLAAPPPRTPWPLWFPKVVVHTDLALRDSHPLFAAAKAGRRPSIGW